MIESGYKGDDRRRFPRIAVTFGVRMIDVSLKRTDAFPSNTPCYETHFVATDAVGNNISEGGFAFESHKRFSVSGILGLEFALPQQQEHWAYASNASRHYGDRGFRALGQVVWTTSLEETYIVGVRFMDLDPRRSDAVRRLIAVHNTRNHSSKFIRNSIPDSLAQR